MPKGIYERTESHNLKISQSRKKQLKYKTTLTKIFLNQKYIKEGNKSYEIF